MPETSFYCKKNNIFRTRKAKQFYTRKHIKEDKRNKDRERQWRNRLISWEYHATWRFDIATTRSSIHIKEIFYKRTNNIFSVPLWWVRERDRVWRVCGVSVCVCFMDVCMGIMYMSACVTNHTGVLTWAQWHLRWFANWFSVKIHIGTRPALTTTTTTANRRWAMSNDTHI